MGDRLEESAGREREGSVREKGVGGKTSLISYTKSRPKAKRQQPTYKQKSKMERLRNLTAATGATLGHT